MIHYATLKFDFRYPSLFACHNGGAKIAQAQFSGDYGNGQDGVVSVDKNDTLYTDSVRARVVGERCYCPTSAPDKMYVYIDTAHYHGKFKEGDKVVIIQMENGNNHKMGFYAVDWIKDISHPDRIELDGRGIYQGDQFNTGHFDYNASVQIIKVPEYENATVEDGGVVTCHPWNGYTGGVSMFFVWNKLSIQRGGKVTAKGKGFFENGTGAEGGKGGKKANIKPGKVPGGDAGDGKGPEFPAFGECVRGEKGFSGEEGGNGSVPGDEGKQPRQRPTKGVKTNRPAQPNHKTLQTRMVMGANGDGGEGGKGGQGGGSGGAGGALLSKGQTGAANGQFGGVGEYGGNGGDGGRGGGIVYIKAHEWQTPVLDECIDVSGLGGEDGSPGGRGGAGGKGGRAADGFFDECEYIGKGGPGASGARGDGAGGGSGGDGGDAGMFWWTYSKSNDLVNGNVAIKGGEKGEKALGGNPGEKNRGNPGQSYIDRCDNCDDEEECSDCLDSGPNQIVCADETFDCACDIAFEMLSYTTGYDTVNNGNVIGKTNEVPHPDFPKYEVQCKYKKDDTSRWLECEVESSTIDCANGLGADRNVYVCSLESAGACDDMFNSFHGEDLKNIADRDFLKTIEFGQKSIYHFPFTTLKSLNSNQECSNACGKNTFCEPGSSLSHFGDQDDCATAGKPGKDGEKGKGYGPSGNPEDPLPTDEGEDGQEKNKQERGSKSDSRNKRAASTGHPGTSTAFEVFPNPTDGSLTIAMKEKDDQQNYLVTIKNTEGKALVKRSFELPEGKGRHTLDLNQLSKGAYFLELQAGKKPVIRKQFVVK